MQDNCSAVLTKEKLFEEVGLADDGAMEGRPNLRVDNSENSASWLSTIAQSAFICCPWCADAGKLSHRTTRYSQLRK